MDQRQDASWIWILPDYQSYHRARISRMIGNIELFCFGASYSAALAAEVAAAKWPLKSLRSIGLGFTIAGLMAQTLYTTYRVVGLHVLPFGSSFDSILVLGWMLAILYLTFRWVYPKIPSAFLALPILIGLTAIAQLHGPDQERQLEGLARIWGPIHGGIVVLAAMAVTIGFVAGVLYLVQSYRLKAKKRSPSKWELPSLESLERVNSRVMTVAFALLTIGLGTGLLLAVQQRMQVGQTNIQWFDPKVISAAVMWLAFGFLTQARHWPFFRGRKAAFFTVVVFFLLLFTIVGVDLFLDSWHQSEPITARGGDQ